MSNTQGLRFHSAAGLSAVLAALIGFSCPAISDEVDDQLKKGKLFDIGASQAAVVTYKQALTVLSLKKHALERKQQLFRQQLATPQDVETAEEDLADAEAMVKMAEEQFRGE